MYKVTYLYYTSFTFQKRKEEQKKKDNKDSEKEKTGMNKEKDESESENKQVKRCDDSWPCMLETHPGHECDFAYWIDRTPLQNKLRMSQN